MSKLSFASLLAFGLAVAASADIPNRPKTPLHEAISPHASGGATGSCSIVYYNVCSGWLWVWSGWAQGDEVGVVFDLPAACGTLPGESCTNMAFWWYWRYTTPGWGYTITYNLYRVDEQFCKLGPPLGTISGYDPSEHSPPPLVFPGLDLTGRIAIIASWDKGALPVLATDNNVRNYAAPSLCPGYAPSAIHSIYWGGLITQYCPPLDFHDSYGPVQIIMDAASECHPSTGTTTGSWTSVKSLFR